MNEKRIGLTGGIASGKSTVSKLLRQWGYWVIDADEIYHELTDVSSPLTKELARCFGESILRYDGSLDRKKMGTLIFADSRKRDRLNAITHPAVFHAMQERAAEWKRVPHEGKKNLLFFDIPLLIETWSESSRLGFDAIWLVSVSPKVQRERLMQRDGIGEQEALCKINTQMPLLEKEAFATRILRNNQDPAHLELEVKTALLKELE